MVVTAGARIVVVYILGYGGTSKRRFALATRHEQHAAGREIDSQRNMIGQTNA